MADHWVLILVTIGQVATVSAPVHKFGIWNSHIFVIICNIFEHFVICLHLVIHLKVRNFSPASPSLISAGGLFGALVAFVTC